MEVKTLAPQFRGIPKLDGDAYLGPKLDKYGSGARLKLERRIVWNLIRHLQANGFLVHSVFDGEDYIKTLTPKAAMESVFSVDESTLRFYDPAAPEELKGRLLGVLLIGGNGVDIVSDYSAPREDPHNWNGVMGTFDSSDYE